MRTIEEYKRILTLWNAGQNQSEIARQTQIPRGTIRDCIKKFSNVDSLIQQLNSGDLKPNAFANNNVLNKIKNLSDETLCKNYCYALGIYLGDGCISPARRVWKIRIACDAKYPGIIRQISNAFNVLFENNIVNVHAIPNTNCRIVQCYSKDLLLFFPSHKSGNKYQYGVQLEPWQKEVITKYPLEFWLGLFHADGCRFVSQGYIKYEFAQKSEDIKNIFLWVCNLLQLNPTVRQTNKDNKYHCYRVGLCKIKDVSYLEALVGPKT